MKKKILGFGVIAVLIVMLFALTGCGSSNNEENKKEKGKLADVVSIGDKIAYDPGEGTYTEEDIENDGYEKVKIDRTIHANDITTWIVIDISDSGEVTIMAENPTERTVTLNGVEGYNKGPEILDRICEIFLNKDQGAKVARSIRIDDINKLEEYTPKIERKTKTIRTRIEVSSNGLLEEGDSFVTNPIEEIELEVSEDNLAYSYQSISDCISRTSAFWIASSCLDVSSSCDFSMRVKGSNGYITSLPLADSEHGFTVDHDLPVMPVVVLKSSVKTTGMNDAGIYELK